MDRLIANLASISPINRLATRLLGHYVTIFMLHRPAPAKYIYNGINVDLLERCLQYAKQKDFEFASIDKIVDMAIQHKKPKKPTICFTIDDGYLDQLTKIVPVMLKYKAEPTIFVLSDFSDQQDWPWDAKIIYLSHNTQQEKLTLEFEEHSLELDFSCIEKRISSRRKITQLAKHLPDAKQDALLDILQNRLQVQLPQKAPAEHAPADWESLRHYQKMGLHIGSHGKTHKVFSILSDAKIQEELQNSRDRLLQEIPDASKVFCYSSGMSSDYQQRHCPLVAAAGYSAAVSAKPGNTTLKAINHDLFNIKRHSFPSSYEKFVRYISWIEFLRTKIS